MFFFESYGYPRDLHVLTQLCPYTTLFRSRFLDAVSTAMETRLHILDMKSPIADLPPIFDRGHVAIVTDGKRFLGLITRIDLLNYLRRSSEERRVGQECVSPCRSRWSPSH